MLEEAGADITLLQHRDVWDARSFDGVCWRANLNIRFKQANSRLMVPFVAPCSRGSLHTP